MQRYWEDLTPLEVSSIPPALSAMAFKILGVALLLCLLVNGCFSFSEDSPTDQRVLVLVDDVSIRESHSVFLKSLTGIAAVEQGLCCVG